MDLSQTAITDAFKLVLVSWPNGWHRHLVVNTAPFEDSSGRVGGAVAAFIEREPWSASSSR